MIPVVGLFYLTYQIRVELKKRDERLIKYAANHVTPPITHKGKATGGLVIIIIAFITLHSFRIIWVFGEVYLLLNPNKNDSVSQPVATLPSWCYIIASLSELFMVINSTVNVIIYFCTL